MKTKLILFFVFLLIVLGVSSEDSSYCDEGYDCVDGYCVPSSTSDLAEITFLGYGDYYSLDNDDYDSGSFFNEMNEHGVNLVRSFVWMSFYPNGIPSWLPQDEDNLPYKRMPFVKLDENKYDLSEYDEAYFRNLKNYMSLAEENGIVIQLALFHGWQVVWDGRYNVNLDLNLIGGDPADISSPEGDFIGANLYDIYSNGELNDFGKLQRQYVQKVVSETEEFPNIIYEVVNEMGEASDRNLEWHRAVIDWIEEIRPDAFISTSSIVPGIRNQPVFGLDGIDIISLHYGPINSWQDESDPNHGTGKIKEIVDYYKNKYGKEIIIDDDGSWNQRLPDGTITRTNNDLVEDWARVSLESGASFVHKDYLGYRHQCYDFDGSLIYCDEGEMDEDILDRFKELEVEEFSKETSVKEGYEKDCIPRGEVNYCEDFDPDFNGGEYFSEPKSLGLNGNQIDAVLDDEGNIHLTYVAGSTHLAGDSIAYAKLNTEGELISQKIFDELTYGYNTLRWFGPQIDVDSNGEAHIAYADFFNGVYYINPQTGSINEIFSSACDQDPSDDTDGYEDLGYAGIAIDSQDNIHIVFTHQEFNGCGSGGDSTAQIHYMSSNGGSSFRDLGEIANIPYKWPMMTSLEGKIYSVFDDGQNGIALAEYSSGSWNFKKISGEVGLWLPNIAKGKEKPVIISSKYFEYLPCDNGINDPGANRYVYATYYDGGWKSDQIHDFGNDACDRASDDTPNGIAQDKQGNIYALYSQYYKDKTYLNIKTSSGWIGSQIIGSGIKSEAEIVPLDVGAVALWAPNNNIMFSKLNAGSGNYPDNCCGNNKCEKGEDSSNCPEDCGSSLEIVVSPPLLNPGQDVTIQISTSEDKYVYDKVMFCDSGKMYTVQLEGEYAEQQNWIVGDAEVTFEMPSISSSPNFNVYACSPGDEWRCSWHSSFAEFDEEDDPPYYTTDTTSPKINCLEPSDGEYIVIKGETKDYSISRSGLNDYIEKEDDANMSYSQFFNIWNFSELTEILHLEGGGKDTQSKIKSALMYVDNILISNNISSRVCGGTGTEIDLLNLTGLGMGSYELKLKLTDSAGNSATKTNMFNVLKQYHFPSWAVYYYSKKRNRDNYEPQGTQFIEDYFNSNGNYLNLKGDSSPVLKDEKKSGNNNYIYASYVYFDKLTALDFEISGDDGHALTVYPAGVSSPVYSLGYKANSQDRGGSLWLQGSHVFDKGWYLFVLGLYNDKEDEKLWFKVNGGKLSSNVDIMVPALIDYSDSWNVEPMNPEEFDFSSVDYGGFESFFREPNQGGSGSPPGGKNPSGNLPHLNK